MKLRVHVPDFPWIEGDKNIASGEWRWTSPISLGEMSCHDDEIVTGVKCVGKNCGSVHLK